MSLGEWCIEAGDRRSAPAHVLDWCREVLANCRRPFGIDQFDLALACRDAETDAIRSHRFIRLTPHDLYADSFLAQLAVFLRSHEPQATALIIAAAIFSWGEAAHLALPTEL